MEYGGLLYQQMELYQSLSQSTNQMTDQLIKKSTD